MTKHPISNVPQNDASIPSRLITPGELSEMLGIPIATLYAWRYHGKGPTGVRVGRHLRYRRDEVDAWISHAERDQGRRK